MPQISPTKSNLISSQKALELALLGYELLDKKKNMLLAEESKYTARANELRAKVNAVYRKAYKALELASATLGSLPIHALSIKEDNSFVLERKEVMSLTLPTITLPEKHCSPDFGFIGTNAYLDEAAICFKEAKEITAALCSVEATCKRLASAVKKTSTRANALGNIRIPQLREQIKLISEALDEKEREEFSRLKIIKEQK